MHFHVEQEHDQLVYTYYDKNIVLKPGVPRIVAEADDSQCRTTITATDSRTNLIMFRYTTDQSVFQIIVHKFHILLYVFQPIVIGVELSLMVKTF